MSEVFNFTGIVFMLFLVVVIIVFALEFNKRQNKHYKEKELMNAQFEQALLQSRLEIQEQTFKTIAQELHDNIGQLMTLAQLNLHTAHLSPADKGFTKVDEAQQILTTAISAMRNLAKTMNTDTINQVGIVAAIQLELEAIQRASGIETQLEQNDHLPEIDPQVQLILFRIIQESFNNILKHAKASLICVKMQSDPTQMKLAIRDNGNGFATHDAQTNGSGLNNMASRCKLIGANLQVNSRPGEGTNIFIHLPLTKKEVV